ncbi:SufE family protein [Alkalitalea saponilacus]|uniref:Cysteine desulfuration protein SufE n=1 Tax=Alkalitalea saponilacus TaxID=889453 RepID=A0A1T5FUL9_9BACT|nr:SufE family protein [Alkalitalea saponilacus]ASB49498.1 Fe-S metabolism protein SufE [Alkalitalea saponilacus]SKB99856.1 cysteine desulfuration protein SufE [Alkalitalea saponilacus]
MTIKEIQDEIVDEFSMLTEKEDKYLSLIEIGNKLESFEEEHRTEQNLIEGCQAKVWLHAWLDDDKIRFMADSDAIIVKGIISLLIRILDKRKPNEILESELFFVDKIGLKELLSPTRSNGLVSMVKQMRMYALAFKTKMEN